MRTPNKSAPPDGESGWGQGSADATNVAQECSRSVIAMPTGWDLAMRRAHAIGRYRRGPLQFAAVRHWRIAVQAALGQEARP